MKRIAIISTMFYPFPAVGAVRVTNWARALPALGYQPLVVCRDYGYRASRATLSEAVHPDVEVAQLRDDGTLAPTEDKVKASAASKPLSSNFFNEIVLTNIHRLFVPDSQILSWHRLYPAIREIVAAAQPDVVLSTCPTFSVLEVGRRLKADLGVPWIADYRDPMLLDDRFRPQGWARILWPRFAAFERRVYEQADAILHAVPLHARWARMHYPFARRRCAILRHPVPDDLLNGSLEPIRSESVGRRSICVVGFIRPQVVGLLARAIRQLVDEDHQTYDLELRLVGRNLDDPQPIEEILGSRLKITGRLRHDLAKRHIAGADVLVNAVSSERRRVVNVSSKLFEYAAARKPIISINSTRSDKRLLRKLSVVDINQPTVAELSDALRKALARDTNEVASTYREFLESQSWERHCQQLQLVLDEVTKPSGSTVDLRDLGSLIPAGKP
ncbi:MAG: glycosyltransferase [Bythopirellula sp.]|nr:glycosyltransferase [Bythopirellula sp.]